MERDSLYVLTEEEVMRLGIPLSSKGYYYLIIAVVLSVEMGLNKVSLSKDIYCRIAEYDSVSAESVEKCIRNCVLKAWRCKDSGLRNSYPVNGKKPTNGEVIAYISSRIRLESVRRI